MFILLKHRSDKNTTDCSTVKCSWRSWSTKSITTPLRGGTPGAAVKVHRSRVRAPLGSARRQKSCTSQLTTTFWLTLMRSSAASSSASPTAPTAVCLCPSTSSTLITADTSVVVLLLLLLLLVVDTKNGVLKFGASSSRGKSRGKFRVVFWLSSFCANFPFPVAITVCHRHRHHSVSALNWLIIVRVLNYRRELQCERIDQKVKSTNCFVPVFVTTIWSSDLLLLFFLESLSKNT